MSFGTILTIAFALIVLALLVAALIPPTKPPE